MEDIKEKRRKYYRDNIDRIKEYSKKYKQINADRVKKYNKKYKQINADKVRKWRKEWKKNNPEKVKEYRRKRRLKNTEYQRVYQRERIRNNPIYRLHKNLSRAINYSLKGGKNGRSWNKLVGYDTQELKRHLERQFREGMTWENYGKWHIDHRIPISLFNITSEKCKGFKKCWALENLQPMWQKENLKKSNKLFMY